MNLQEDKEPLFDSVETLLVLLPAVSGMIATTEFDRAKMAAAAPTGFSLATEIADFLVRAHIQFSQAHEAAGACVALCEKTNCELHELTDAEFLAIHPSLTGGVREVITVAGALSSRTTAGGTAPAEVTKQLKDLTAKNSQSAKLISSRAAAFSGMMSA